MFSFLLTGTSFYGKETLALKKFIKWFGFLAAAGTAAGVVAAYVLKNRSEDSAEKEPDLTEDEDYDLDADLQPAAEREYVSLNSRPGAAEETEDSGNKEDAGNTEESDGEEAAENTEEPDGKENAE